MKEKILRLIENNIVAAKDNAYRARMQFGGMTSEQFDKEYGESGRKCRDILAEYEDAEKEAADMKVWFMINTSAEQYLIGFEDWFKTHGMPINAGIGYSLEDASRRAWQAATALHQETINSLLAVIEKKNEALESIVWKRELGKKETQYQLAVENIAKQALAITPDKVRLVLEAMRKDAERYQFVRKLNPREFAEIYDINIKTGVHFDHLITQAIAMKGEK